jgi:hypothetical protein
MLLPLRQYAVIKGFSGPLRTNHYWCKPGESKRLMPIPEVLILESDGSSTMLYRYTLTGEYCGDTWHQSVDEALEQAKYEYGDAIGPLEKVPNEVQDAAQYAIEEVRNERDT